ncbi:hypothetical protein ABI59_21270 [Acidobacteria bacterium Mor1]|nr:hypothetical protein ABI59_21270 [Acidobacteria bacterium Mor1]
MPTESRTPWRRHHRPAAWLCLLALAALMPQTFASQPSTRLVDIPGVPAEVAALIMSGQQGGTIELRALAVPLPSAEAPSAVVVLEMPLEDLLADPYPGSIQTEVYGYVLDSEDRLAGALSKAFELRSADPGSLPAGLKVLWSLGLGPGEYTVRLLVRDHRSPRMGLAMVRVEVPPLDEQVAIMPPMVGNPPDSWTVLRLDEGPGWGLSAMEPAAAPLLPARQQTVLQVLARNLAADESLDAEWELPDGSRSSHPAIIQDRSPVGTSGLELVTVLLQPSGLEAGEYDLRLVPASGEGTALPTPISLVDRSSGSFAWTGGGAVEGESTVQANTDGATAAEGGAVGESAEDASIRQRGRRFRDRFVEVMRLASEGRSVEASEQLGSALEDAFDGEAQADTRVSRAERREIRRVTRAAADSLIPIIEVYREAHKNLWRGRAYLLSSHCRRTAMVLIETYLERGGDRDTAVAMLASLALDAQRLGMSEIAEEVLGRCMRMESRQPAVLITLASVEERQGRYESAAGLMQELLKLEPDQHGARLRLAVNLERLGQYRRAEQHLRAVIGQADGWVRSVAYQELGRKLIKNKRRDEARELLEEATERLPDDEKLHLLLAFTHELEDKPWMARAVLDSWRNRRVDTRFAPRHRYAELPLRELGELRRLVHDSLEAGRQHLAEALGADS